MANYICISRSGDGDRNLAMDGWFLDNVKKGDIILYFYVNTRAVIIGRHQNAWKECRVANMAANGVQLVRRHSGGGAVYHDAGNLNFSFIMGERDYDLDRQMSVITSAVRRLGLEPELSGRNDVLIGGRKFSGNAYSLAHGNRSHHGTVLVNADLSVFSNYLNVSKAKIRSKGVESVRSRVCNLSEFADITVEEMRDIIIDCFIAEYGPAEEYVFSEEALREIAEREKRQRSWEWRFGKTPEFDLSLDHRFSFGEMQFHLKLREGRIRSAKVYSDCLDTSLPPEAEAALTGVLFRTDDIRKALSEGGPALAGGPGEEIAAFFEENGPDNID